MSKWLGPGTLRLKSGKDIITVQPGGDFDKKLFDSEERFNQLLEKGFIEGVKARKPKGAGE